MARRLVIGIAALGVLSAAWVGPVSADPVNAKKGEVLPINCEGTEYQVALNGNGEFTPGHDLNGTRVFIPVAFGVVTGVVTDADGIIIDTFTEEAVTKGAGSAKKDGLTECSFTFSFTNTGSTEQDGVPPGATVTGSGTVIVKITPSSR